MGLWKDTRKEAGWQAEHSVFAIGDGRKVCFQGDRWCGINPLCATYPSVYSLAAPKGVSG